MTAIKEPLAPPPQDTSSNRNNRAMSNNIKPMTFKPMSNLPRSAELDEYTQSMKAYLANLGHQPPISGSDGGQQNNNAADRRDQSPEFRWMDLAALRREYSNMSMTTKGVSKIKSSSSLSSSGHKLSHRNSNARHYLAHDHRHRFHHIEHRPASPSGKSVSSSSSPSPSPLSKKKQPVH